MRKNIVIGSVLTLAAVFMIALNLVNTYVSSTIVSVGLIMVIIGVLRGIRKKQMPSTDERLRKISNQSLAYSWLITLVTVTIAFWLNYFGTSISTNTLISVLFFEMILTANVFQYYFKKKGNVE